MKIMKKKKQSLNREKALKFLQSFQESGTPIPRKVNTPSAADSNSGGAIKNDQSQRGDTPARENRGRGGFRGMNRGRGEFRGMNRGRGEFHGMNRGRGEFRGMNRGRGEFRGMNRGRGEFRGMNRGRGEFRGVNRGRGEFRGMNRGRGEFRGMNRGRGEFRGMNRGRGEFRGVNRGRGVFRGMNRGRGEFRGMNRGRGEFRGMNRGKGEFRGMNRGRGEFRGMNRGRDSLGGKIPISGSHWYLFRRVEGIDSESKSSVAESTRKHLLNVGVAEEEVESYLQLTRKGILVKLLKEKFKGFDDVSHWFGDIEEGEFKGAIEQLDGLNYQSIFESMVQLLGKGATDFYAFAHGAPPPEVHTNPILKRLHRLKRPRTLKDVLERTKLNIMSKVVNLNKNSIDDPTLPRKLGNRYVYSREAVIKAMEDITKRDINLSAGAVYESMSALGKVAMGVKGYDHQKDWAQEAFDYFCEHPFEGDDNFVYYAPQARNRKSKGTKIKFEDSGVSENDIPD